MTIIGSDQAIIDLRKALYYKVQVPHETALAGTGAGERTRFALGGTLLILVVLLAYLPALRGGFVWDDDKYVTENRMLTAPDGLQQIWFSAHHQSQYFPLVYTTLRIERALWGLNPFGYHLINVLLHGFNAVLVWVVLKRLAVPGAWLAAAIFGLHPVQVESVAWVTELKNTQSTLFYLLALLAWMGFTDRPTAERWRWYAAALFLYALALFSKTTACTFPVAMLLALWLRNKPVGWMAILQAAPFMLFGIAMGLVSVWWEGHMGDYDKGLDLSFNALERLLIASRALWFYAAKLAWPANLTFIYPRWKIDPSDPWQYAGLMGCAALAFLLWQRRHAWGRGCIVAVCFFAVTLLPLLGFISLYTFIYSFAADHYQYVASIGLVALFTALASRGATAWHVDFRAQRTCSFLLLLVLGVLTWKQATVYRDLETLWRDTLSKNPACGMAHNNLGLCLYNRGRFGEAIDQYRAALQINPRHANALNNLGNALCVQGRLDEAIENYRKAIQIESDYAPFHINLGMALEASGRTRDAMVEYWEALRLSPRIPRALNNLAHILASSPDSNIRNGNAAVRLAERACQLTAFNEALYVGTLGAAYAEAGRFDEAERMAQKAEALATAAGDPELAEENRKLAALFESRRPLRVPADAGNATPAGGKP